MPTPPTLQDEIEILKQALRQVVKEKEQEKAESEHRRINYCFLKAKYLALEARLKFYEFVIRGN